MKRILVSRNRYFDSVFLMQAAKRMASQPGIRDASALLATEANRKMLADLGYGQAGELSGLGPGDLVIAINGDPAAVDAIAAAPERWLQPGSGESVPDAQSLPHSIREAVAAHPEANMAVISVPGHHAAREARSAIEQGLNVFLFSSNVSVDDELSLKKAALAKGLIVMGPDCGTAFIAGAGLGFANVVRRGPIGIVGSSGTGMQEFASLVHRAGAGISHGIGVGSRDLSDAIGGLSMFAALDALEADPQTRVIAIVAKPPGQAVAARLVERCSRSGKPVVLCLLAARALPVRQGSLRSVALIDDAVEMALQLAGFSASATYRHDGAAMRKQVASAMAGMDPGQRHVRGLFAGGTLCCQTQLIFRRAGLRVSSNAPVAGAAMLADPDRSTGDTFVDMGGERFVAGRPHPMIDSTLRRNRLREEAADPSVALVVLDFVLGTNASRDPVGDLLPAMREAMDAAVRRGGRLRFAASVCGTDGDAQDLASQTRALADAGVDVFPSNAQAATFACEVAIALDARDRST